MERAIKDYKQHLLNQLTYTLSKDMYSATERDKYNAMVLSIRSQIVNKWINTQQAYYRVDAKRLYYLSLEFLMGRLLKNYLINLEHLDVYREAIEVLATNLEDVFTYEFDAGL
jgi:glycogen phosphorylase